MPVALNDEQLDLARSVASFAQRCDARASTREHSGTLKAGHRPDLWPELVRLGLHAVHLSEKVGGQGGDIGDLAVVIGEAGKALIPGPLLPTVCASALVARADSDEHTTEILKRFATGTTATVICPQPSLTVTEHHGQIHLNGVSAAVLGAASAQLRGNHQTSGV